MSEGGVYFRMNCSGVICAVDGSSITRGSHVGSSTSSTASSTTS